MPKLTVEGFGSVEVRTASGWCSRSSRTPRRHPARLRRQRALHDLPRRVHRGRAATMTVAERQVLAAKGVTGVRLSCQIVCDHDMTVRAISRLDGQRPPRSRAAAGAGDHAAAGVDSESLIAQAVSDRSVASA